MSTGEVAGKSGSEGMTEAVVRALARQEGVAPEKLTPPLYEAIDTEALEDLFKNTRGRVTFEYLGYVVTVDDEYSVEISDSR